MLISKSTPRLVWRLTGTPTPIPFIVGMPRSGTTLLRLMLDAHPDLAIPPETGFIRTVVRTCGTRRTTADCFLTTLVSDRRWADHHVDADVLRQRLAGLRPFRLSDGLRLFYELYAARFNKPRWGDKTPVYLDFMHLIQDLFPEARFVHLIRDGRDVTVSSLSIENAWFGPKSVSGAAGQWSRRIARARRQVQHLRYYLEIRYEDLVLQTEPTLRTICRFIDLPWEPAMLDYHAGAEQRLAEFGDHVAPDGSRMVRSEERRSLFAWTTRPPQASRVGRWRTQLTRCQRAQFEEVAGETLRELGYDVG